MVYIDIYFFLHTNSSYSQFDRFKVHHILDLVQGHKTANFQQILHLLRAHPRQPLDVSRHHFLPQRRLGGFGLTSGQSLDVFECLRFLWSLSRFGRGTGWL